MSQYLGDISAYALAVSQGYTGTEEEYAELMASYATVGQTAVTAAQTATTKASEAATSATTATNKASKATTAATTATNKAAEAQADADAAALDASQAMSAASTATTKATEATTAAATAVSAKDDAVSANTAAQSAKTAAQTAQTGAETAAASVQSSAAQIQTNADDISELKEDLSEISEITRNLLDVNNWSSPNSSMKVENDIATNVLTDTRSYLSLYVRTYNGSSVVDLIYSESETVRHKKLTFTATGDADRIRLTHSGSTKDLNIVFLNLAIESGKTYTLSFDITGANPTVAGGVTIEKIQLETGSTETEYIEHETAVDRIIRETVSKNSNELEILLKESNLFIDSNYILIDGTLQSTYISASVTGKTAILPLTEGKKYVLFRGITDNYLTLVGCADGNEVYANISGYKALKGTGGLYLAQDDENVNPYVFTVPSGYPYFAITYTLTNDAVYSAQEILDSIFVFEYGKISYLVDVANKINSVYNPLTSLFADEVTDTINTAKNKMTSKALVLGVITDTHIDADRDVYYIRSTQNMKSVCDALSFDVCVHLGDIIDGGETKSDEVNNFTIAIKNLLSIGAKKTIAVLGNHDNNGLNPDDLFTPAEIYGQMLQFSETEVIRDGITSNYYIDYDFIKIRLIIVDSCYNTQGFSTDTISWVSSVMESAPNDYSFVFLSHEPTRGSLIRTNASASANSAEFEAVLAAYTTRVLGYIHGHTHFDNVSYVNGYPEISIACGQPFETTSSNLPTDATVPSRTIGSVTQDAWDVVIVLPDENKFELVRFGAGSNRTVHFRTV